LLYTKYEYSNTAARLYDPTIARFLSADPTLFHPFDTQNFNRYSYVRNNPLYYTDPSGYDWEDDDDGSTWDDWDDDFDENGDWDIDGDIHDGDANGDGFGVKVNEDSSSSNIVTNTLTVIGGSLQVVTGLVITWTAPTPLGEMYGMTLSSLGANNIQSIFTGDTTIKDAINKEFGSSHAYTAIDLSMSLGAAIPSGFARTGEIKSIGNYARHEYNFDTSIGKGQAFIEAIVDSNTIQTSGN